MHLNRAEASSRPYSSSSLASIAGLVLGGMLYPGLGGQLFLVAAGLFAVILVLTGVWFDAGDEGRTGDSA